MKVYRNGPDGITSCVLALGSFDTIHIGHQRLINAAADYAVLHNLPVGVHMFDVRPGLALNSSALKDVYSSVQREEILHQLNIDILYYEKFDGLFREKTPEEFVLHLKNTLRVKAVFAGFNYRFGKNASGDSACLKALCAKHDIDVHILPPVCDAYDVVSSTRVRECLLCGEVENAHKLLGRYYSMCGCITQDRGVGHEMGVPTANLAYSEALLLPKDGVYMTVADIDGRKYPAVTNIGIRPTFCLEQRTVETHILDFDADLYGIKLHLDFVARIRDERTFDDIQSLIEQISKDKVRAKEIFSEINV